ncbi:MAG TPA: DHA2 family efflux MFS transporter permease subunit [Beijerinckiaceae bacterium]|nr:DHA2 family efflux MFS transporter permease subunit [Beijerinckiaceae bacterium]
MQRRVIVPLIVACALLMQNLDSTSLNTALPAIARALAVSPLRLHLAITSYMLAQAAFLPISGWAADRFGSRLVFRVAIATFGIASALCGVSQGFGQLIGARILQGIGGAMMVPVGRLILVRSVPKTELVGAMALMGMPALIGPISGPVLGGFITTYFSWRWIFWINVPIGVLGIVLVTLFIEDSRDVQVRQFDFTGFALSSFGLAGTLFGLDAATSADRASPIGLVCLVVGLACCVLYVVHARRNPHPILDLALFKLQTFRASVTGGSLFRIGMGALPFLLPLLLQEGFGYSPLQSGLVTFVAAAGSLGMRTIARRVLKLFGFRQVLIWNSLVSCIFIIACAAFRPDTSRVLMMIVIFLGGVFRSLEFTSANAIGFADIDAPQLSHATTFSQMAQRLSLSFGVGISAFILHQASGPGPRIPIHAFSLAFVIVGVLSAFSALPFAQLDRDAGAAMAGRLPKAHGRV